MNKADVKRIIAEVIQPLQRGLLEYKKNITSKIYDIVPFGFIENAQNASPYGIVSWPVKGVYSFFQTLGGDSRSTIIINHLDPLRPTPTQEGEYITYSRNKEEVVVRVHLRPTGVLEIYANTKVKIHCDDIELGDSQLEKILNGETFQKRFNEHVHKGNMGVDTSPPVVPSPPEDLSNVVKAKK